MDTILNACVHYSIAQRLASAFYETFIITIRLSVEDILSLKLHSQAKTKEFYCKCFLAQNRCRLKKVRRQDIRGLQ